MVDDAPKLQRELVQKSCGICILTTMQTPEREPDNLAAV